MKKLLIFSLLLLMIGSSAAAQEAEPTELPVIPYYTSSEQFNIPIPSGWSQISNTSVAELAYPDVDGAIYTIAVEADDAQSAFDAAITEIAPEIETELRLTGEITLDGLDWYKSLYDIAGGGNITVFIQQRETDYYAILFINRNPEIDLYMLAIKEEAEGVGVDVSSALNELYPDVELTPAGSHEVELSNGTWTRSDYELPNGEELHTLHQIRFNTTYIIVERGNGETLDTVNKALFTVLFGFFVTPQNSDYLILGIVIGLGLVIGLIISMILRYRSLQKDEQLIETLKQDAN